MLERIDESMDPVHANGLVLREVLDLGGRYEHAACTTSNRFRDTLVGTGRRPDLPGKRQFPEDRGRGRKGTAGVHPRDGEGRGEIRGRCRGRPPGP